MVFERRLALGLFAAGGVLTAHELAYAFVAAAHAAADPRLGHADLGLLWAVLGPLAALALGRLAVLRVRRLVLPRRLRAGVITAAVLPAFATLEVAERVVTGQSWGSAFVEPAVLLGLALCPLVGWVFARLIVVAAELLDAAPAARPKIRGADVGLLGPGIALLPQRIALLIHSVSRRGPPWLS